MGTINRLNLLLDEFTEENDALRKNVRELRIRLNNCECEE